MRFEICDLSFEILIMCFQIPKKIKAVKKNIAVMEDGTTVKMGNLNAQKGDYLSIYGDMAVEKLDNERARKARLFINKLDNK